MCGSSLAENGVTTITDFSTLFNGGAVDGITLPNANMSNASLTGTGGIKLDNGSLGFDMSSATYQPSVISGGKFSIAMTFAAGSLGNSATLFNTTYVNKPGAFNGLFGAKYENNSISVGYYGNSQQSAQFPSPSISLADTNENITVVWSKSLNGPDNKLSLSVYYGASLLGTLTSKDAQDFNGSLVNILSIGGKGVTDASNVTNAFPASSDLELIGMQTMVGSVMDEAAFQDYYAQIVPEPATASLGLLGLASLLMRRRRV